jgi:hypothetical protein
MNDELKKIVFSSSFIVPTSSFLLHRSCLVPPFCSTFYPAAASKPTSRHKLGKNRFGQRLSGKIKSHKVLIGGKFYEEVS